MLLFALQQEILFDDGCEQLCIYRNYIFLKIDLDYD